MVLMVNLDNQRYQNYLIKKLNNFKDIDVAFKHHKTPYPKTILF